MKKVLPIISFAALALLIVPAILFLAGSLPLESMKLLMLIATVVWFVVTPCWMDQKVD
jgi:hypothetical protein